MTGIFGALNITEAAAERTYINTIGQELVYDAVREELDRYNAELAANMALFVEDITTNFKERYELPGGGYLQRMGPQSQAAAVKASGNWDVAYPLEDFGAQFSRDRIGFAYMTVAQLDKHMQTVIKQDQNTVRREMMKALLDNGTYAFTDPIFGSLTVQPLANGDGTLYPPTLGSDTEADDTHHLETGYAAASISNTNDPSITVRDELEEHFGAPTAGSNIVMLTTPTIADYMEGLADFDPVVNRNITPGANTDVPNADAFGIRIPGRLRGVCNGIWIAEWRWLPANYSIGIYADAPKPLKMRVDPEYTGLGQGLQLVAEDEKYPFNNAHYSHRFGFGVGNRLNGVVLEFGTGGSYSVPTGFDRS